MTTLRAPFDLNPVNPSPGIWECPHEPTTSEPDPRFIPVTAYGEAARPTVVIEVLGGVAYVAECPAGIDVEIRDYDRGQDARHLDSGRPRDRRDRDPARRHPWRSAYALNCA